MRVLYAQRGTGVFLEHPREISAKFGGRTTAEGSGTAQAIRRAFAVWDSDDDGRIDVDDLVDFVKKKNLQAPSGGWEKKVGDVVREAIDRTGFALPVGRKAEPGQKEILTVPDVLQASTFRVYREASNSTRSRRRRGRRADDFFRGPGRGLTSRFDDVRGFGGVVSARRGRIPAAVAPRPLYGTEDTTARRSGAGTVGDARVRRTAAPRDVDLAGPERVGRPAHLRAAGLRRRHVEAPAPNISRYLAATPAATGRPPRPILASSRDLAGVVLVARQGATPPNRYAPPVMTDRERRDVERTIPGAAKILGNRKLASRAGGGAALKARGFRADASTLSTSSLLGDAALFRGVVAAGHDGGRARPRTTGGARARTRADGRQTPFEDDDPNVKPPGARIHDF